MTKVMVLGASPNKMRFSHTCVKSLLRYGYPVVPIGKKEGEIAGNKILTKTEREKKENLENYGKLK